MFGLETLLGYAALAEVLGFSVVVLTVLMSSSLAAWFAVSTVEHALKIRRIRRPNYDALLRENERLRASLKEAQEKNDYLRKLYRDLAPRAEYEGRNAA